MQNTIIHQLTWFRPQNISYLLAVTTAKLKITCLLTMVTCLLLCSCKDAPPIVKVKAWHDFDRPISEYQKLNPDRPVLVFYTANWDITGQVAGKYLNEPRIFDLFTRFRVLPLIADCTHIEGFAGSEFERTKTEEIWIHCFSLSQPSQETEWFFLGSVSSDEIYKLLKDKLDQG